MAAVGGLAAAWSSRLERRLRREVRARLAAEERLRGLLEQPTVGIYVIQDERFAYVNSRFAEYPRVRARHELHAGWARADLATESDRGADPRKMVRRA